MREEAAMSDGTEQVLDLVGLHCPLPVIKTRRALAPLAVGARVTVRASDPLADLDIPHMCAEDGHRLVSRAVDGKVLIFVIERGDGTRPATVTTDDRTSR